MLRFLGEKLRFLRAQHQRSQVEVAHTLGLASSSHLSYVEAGRKIPSLDLLVLLANYYRVELDFLVRDDRPVTLATPQAIVIDAAHWPQYFAKQLAAHRHEAGLTQAALAKQLVPLTQAFISQLERARKTPSIEILLRVAMVFDVATDDLLLPM